MNNIVIGQYIPGDSWAYKLDPRVKIIALLYLWLQPFVKFIYFNGFDVYFNVSHVFNNKGAIYEND